MLEINSRKRSEYNTYNDVSVQVASTKIAREAAADANLEVFRRVSWKDKDKDKLVSQSCFVLQAWYKDRDKDKDKGKDIQKSYLQRQRHGTNWFCKVALFCNRATVQVKQFWENWTQVQVRLSMCSECALDKWKLLYWKTKKPFSLLFVKRIFQFCFRTVYMNCLQFTLQSQW